MATNAAGELARTMLTNVVGEIDGLSAKIQAATGDRDAAITAAMSSVDTPEATKIRERIAKLTATLDAANAELKEIATANLGDPSMSEDEVKAASAKLAELRKQYVQSVNASRTFAKASGQELNDFLGGEVPTFKGQRGTGSSAGATTDIKRPRVRVAIDGGEPHDSFTKAALYLASKDGGQHKVTARDLQEAWTKADSPEGTAFEYLGKSFVVTPKASESDASEDAPKVETNA